MSTATIMQDFTRVSRRHRCPKCGSSDWCLVSRDDPENPSACICARIESPLRWGGAGWFHRLREHHDRDSGPFHRKPFVITMQGETTQQAITDRVAFWQSRITLRQIEALGGDLGVTATSLRRIGIGWSSNRAAFTFPARNATGSIIGARTRDAKSGAKRSVAGFPLGLIVPDRLPSLTDEDLAVAEGESDTCALLDLGFCAIGRPGCQCCTDLIRDFIILHLPARVLIFADNDEPKRDGRRPGIEGALRLARLVLPHVHEARVILPPAKDIRQWKQQGATRMEVLAAIDGAKPMQARFIIQGAGRMEVTSV